MRKHLLAACILSFSYAPTVAIADGVRVFQTAPIQASETAPGSGVFTTAEGAAWLKRSEDEVDGRVMAIVDKANTPYSIWWVVFNNPSSCTDPCDFDDLFIPAVEAAVFNASGAISAASGALKRNGKPAPGGVINVNLSVHAGEGAGNGSQAPFCEADFCTNIMNEGNGLCAEIHVDINEHEFDGDWEQELTYPENPQAFAVFAPADECDEDD